MTAIKTRDSAFLLTDLFCFYPHATKRVRGEGSFDRRPSSSDDRPAKAKSSVTRPSVDATVRRLSA